MKLYIWLIIACFITGLYSANLTVASAHQGATGIVKERMDHFGQAKQSVRHIKGAVRSEDYEAIITHINAMRPFAMTMADFFPAGSDTSPSEAKETIWQDPDGFSQAIQAYQSSLMSLQQAALRNDLTATKAAFGALGNSCQNCHSRYRQK